MCSQRNPNIKLYGLPWDFPAWLGNGTRNPYSDPRGLATYIIKWVKGAKLVHGLHIDYIGVSEQGAWSVIGGVVSERGVVSDRGVVSERGVVSDRGVVSEQGRGQ